MKVKARDLKLADVIRLNGSDAFRDCVVEKLTETEVWVFRPYMSCADFSYGGGGYCSYQAGGKDGIKVITYIGHEQFSLYRDSDEEYEVLQRKELR